VIPYIHSEDRSAPLNLVGSLAGSLPARSTATEAGVACDGVRLAAGLVATMQSPDEREKHRLVDHSQVPFSQEPRVCVLCVVDPHKSPLVGLGCFAADGCNQARSVAHPSARLQAQCAACPPDNSEVCARANRFSRINVVDSAAIYSVGFFTAFLLAAILFKLDA
jgi:hypothetical protein